MRPIPTQLWITTALYAATLCGTIWFKGWPRGQQGRGAFTTLLVTNLFLVTYCLWLIFTTAAPATGDPRTRGGYSPAEQRALAE